MQYNLTSICPIKGYCNKTANIKCQNPISLKLTVRPTVISLKLQISFCSWQYISERHYVCKRNIVLKFGEMLLFRPTSLQLNLNTISPITTNTVKKYQSFTMPRLQQFEQRQNTIFRGCFNVVDFAVLPLRCHSGFCWKKNNSTAGDSAVKVSSLLS